MYQKKQKKNPRYKNLFFYNEEIQYISLDYDTDGVGWIYRI